MTEVEIKALVRRRDGYKCRDCGMTNDEHLAKYDRVLDVHRVMPGAPYKMAGCVTLCRACHAKKPKKLQQAFFGDPAETGIFVLYFNLYASEDARALEALKVTAEREDVHPIDILNRLLAEFSDSLVCNYVI